MTKDALRAVNWPLILKIAFGAIGALLLMAGFDFTTPAKRFAQQDEKIAHVEAKQERTDGNVGIMLKLTCIGGKVPLEHQQLVGLKCDSLLASGPMQAGRRR